MAAPPTYTILGKGTYGAVVQPALPNMDISGNPIVFGNDMVTKIMFLKDDYNDAKRADADIRARVNRLAIPTYNYKRDYRVYNIENKIPALKAEIDTRRQTGNMNGVYLMRMPNLGVSIHDILDNKARMEQFRALPNKVILREVLKLAYTVRDIRDAGFIHGDIRETNVLCEPTSGRMTIIDFDWFMARDAYLANYPIYFYSHPPEELLLLKGESKSGDFTQYFIDKFPFEEPDLLDMVSKVLLHRVAKRSSTTKYVLGGDVNPHLDKAADIAEGVLLAVLELRRQALRVGPQAAIDVMKEKLRNTVDSYGLGIALYALIHTGLTLPHQADLRQWLLEGLGDLLQPNVYARTTIDDFIAYITPPPSPSENRERLRQNVEAYAALIGAMGGLPPGVPSPKPVLAALPPSPPLPPPPSRRTPTSSPPLPSPPSRRTAKSSSANRRTRKSTPRE